MDYILPFIYKHPHLLAFLLFLLLLLFQQIFFWKARCYISEKYRKLYKRSHIVISVILLAMMIGVVYLKMFYGSNTSIETPAVIHH